MTISPDAFIAAHRFGLGVREDEIATIGRNPRHWLKSQLEGKPQVIAPPAGMPTPVDYMKELPRRMGGPTLAEIYKMIERSYAINAAEVAYRLAAAIQSKQSFRERLVWFWSNHFTVSSANIKAVAFLGAFEREAIRPHVTGKFSDLLKAAERHPAMLMYLDNVSNIGPHSPAGSYMKSGINENLGREAMELHTISVNGGYTQADVIALAKILTGWATGAPGSPYGRSGENGFVYYQSMHEPGPKVLLGKTYESADGEQEGLQALEDLANHPSTAHFIATKLARHFIADDPPLQSVARLETAFRTSGGDLKTVYHALIDDPAAWESARQKARTPLEYIVAVSRGVMPAVPADLVDYAGQSLKDDPLAAEQKAGGQASGGGGTMSGGGMGAMAGRRMNPQSAAAFGLIGATTLLGEYPYSATSPKGWPDDSASWLGPDAVMERVEWSYQLGKYMAPNLSPQSVAKALFGATLSDETRTAIDRAASTSQAFALLFASPEFQRR